MAMFLRTLSFVQVHIASKPCSDELAVRLQADVSTFLEAARSTDEAGQGDIA